MITIKNIFDLLAEGEFAHMNLKQRHTGGLSEEEYPSIIGHINLGLLEFYKRFNFLQDEITLHVNSLTKIYYLRPDRFGLPANMGKQIYLEEDTDNPFDNNILEITNVYNSIGDDLPLNDRRAALAIETISYDTLRITSADNYLASLVLAGGVLNVRYKASYPTITIDEDFDPVTHELHIPDVILEPLLFYIASRVYKSMGSNDSGEGADKSMTYIQKYELACQKIDTFGLDTQINDARTNFDEGGFI